MDHTFHGFDWDAGNPRHCGKHGVSNSEIEDVFHRLLGVAPDPAHSPEEQRYQAVGTNSRGRHVFLVFTFRDRDGKRLIRPISARYMHRAEVELYEKATSRFADR